MSNSLKDQLLSAGLLTQEQVRRNKPKKKRRVKGRAPEIDQDEKERRALVAAHETVQKERARELNRQREQARKAKEQSDRIRQILSSRGLPKAGVDEETSRFNFQLERRVHSLHVTKEQRAKLVDGQLGIVQFDGRYHLVPADQAERIQGLTPNRVWIGKPDEAEVASDDDPYAAYKVPDDLIW